MVNSLGGIAVEVNPGRLGFLLREQLKDQLDQRTDVALPYTLQIETKQVRAPYGGRVNNVASRYGLGVVIRYRLLNTAARTLVTEGGYELQVGYDSADPPYAGVAAQQDAEERAATQAAVLMRLELARFFGRRPAK